MDLLLPEKNKKMRNWDGSDFSFFLYLKLKINAKMRNRNRPNFSFSYINIFLTKEIVVSIL